MSQAHQGRSRSEKDLWTAFGVVVSAIGIILTALFTYFGWERTAEDQLTVEQKTAEDQLRAETKKEAAQLLSDQIHYLYGPLYGSMRASTEAWLGFRSQYRPGKPFWGTTPAPTDPEKQAWFTWMRAVFIPLNQNMETAILNNAHLIDGSEMPDVLVQFLHHAEGYKAVVAQWDKGDFSHPTSDINYPPDLNKYICSTFVKLKTQQAALLGLPGAAGPVPTCNDLAQVQVGAASEVPSK